MSKSLEPRGFDGREIVSFSSLDSSFAVVQLYTEANLSLNQICGESVDRFQVLFMAWIFSR